MIIDNIDILVLTETKLDDTFPSSQFNIEGYSVPYRLDRDKNGGGVLIYIKENIGSKILKKHVLESDIECLFIEVNFRKCKWLLIGTYHPPSQNDQYYFGILSTVIDVYPNYDRVAILGDFNTEDSEECMTTFLYQYDLKNIVKEKTCFKNVDNPSTIDLILTTCPSSFKHTTALTTAISDFHKLIVSVLKLTMPNDKPKEILYRDYKHFDNDYFNQELTNAFSVNEIPDYLCFQTIYMNV